MFEFSERLKRLMNDNNLNAEKLSKALNDNNKISANTIRSYIKGTHKPTNIENIQILANYFNVSTDYLQGYTEAETTNIDIKTICNKYGLSEKSLDNLKKMKEHKKNGDTIIDTTNKLLEQGFYENNDGSSIISLIDSYLEENGRGISLIMKRKNGITTTISGKDVINSFLVILIRELSNMKEGEKDERKRTRKK